MDRQDTDAGLKANRIVICNVSDKVRVVVEQLRHAPGRRPLHISLIVQDDKLWQQHPGWHPPARSNGVIVETFSGCPTDAALLRRAGIEQAYAAVILADPKQGTLADARSTLVGVAIERAAPGVHTVMELMLSTNRSHLRATAVDEVICLGEVAEKIIALSCISPGISRLFSHMLTAAGSTQQLFLPALPPALVGYSFRRIARRAIHRGAPFIACGFIANAAGTERTKTAIVLNPRSGQEPGKDTQLKEGDQLIVLAGVEPDLCTLTNSEE